MPPDFNLEYWFTRLEGKLDKLDEKLDGTVTTQAQHEERIKNLEASKTNGRALWAAVAVAALAWVPDILQAFGK